MTLGMSHNGTHRGAVLISGASTGIGRACALRLSSEGFHVFAGVRKPEDAESLNAQGGPLLTPVILDVTNPSTIEEVRERLEANSNGDGLAGLINNAGISVVGPIEFVSLDDGRRQFEVNFFGHIATTQAMLPLLRKCVQSRGAGSARVINMSSIAGRIAQPILSAYCASKFALESLSDSLRMELHPFGIHVCSVNPGAIDTPIWKKGEAQDEGLPRDADARKLYGPLIDGVIAGAKKAASTAIPTSAVADVVFDCMTRKTPRTRTFVGKDARSGAFVKKFIPDRLFDSILRRYFRND